MRLKLLTTDQLQQFANDIEKISQSSKKSSKADLGANQSTPTRNDASISMQHIKASFFAPTMNVDLPNPLNTFWLLLDGIKANLELLKYYQPITEYQTTLNNTLVMIITAASQSNIPLDIKTKLHVLYNQIAESSYERDDKEEEMPELELVGADGRVEYASHQPQEEDARLEISFSLMM